MKFVNKYDHGWRSVVVTITSVLVVGFVSFLAVAIPLTILVVIARFLIRGI